MNGLLAAKSGWGKSWYTQAWTEANVDEYDRLVVLDFKDEYRGLVKSGYAKHFIVGPREAEAFGVEEWMQFLQQNPQVVLCRHGLDEETWREEVADPVAKANRRLAGSSLTVIDEAHFVAPQRGSVPDGVKGLATTGRGEDASSLWVTQRLTEMDETVLAQMMFTILGGFTSSGDLAKVKSIVEYPKDLHNPQAGKVSHSPEELQRVDASGTKAKGGYVPALEKFTDDDGNTVGSEWIYADESGEMERKDTRNVSMESTHFGAQGKQLKSPEGA
ncbi:ATP-binding protein [Halobacterium noricense]|uniref:ATP-binding protein n=1 Tax=Halobacterium noricense TaxID=223182 RepID=UPI001E4E5F34|nr:ATP-binding protein [Halobacterium noricense]UHH26450.1 ATP-binding protein [Halobacterium noricense]